MMRRIFSFFHNRWSNLLCSLFCPETHFFRSLEHCDITVDLFSLINGNLMRVHKENSGIFLLFCTHPMCITTSLMVIAILFRITYPLFRKSGCEIKLIVQRNASKFAVFYIYENSKLIFPFFISCYFTFFPNEKNKIARNEKRKKQL